ncbi:hypothetical protein GQ600_15302 [Phytophthora cactorum]|nr:hypothetical protein GQ600_15302 [Phytophthora cactorum]
MSSPATLPASQTDANNEKEAANGANPSLSLLELAKATHDPLKASQALHNAEALRQAPALDNVFCSCYDVDTVLASVQRRERGHFSPVQKLLLEPESIKQVFAFATSFSDHLSENGENTEPHPDKYRQAYVATEIILRFYLKAMAWYGEPKQEQNEAETETKEAEKDTKEQVEEMKQPSVKLEGLAVSTEAPPTNLPTMMDFRSNASTRKMARIQRLRASMRFESSGSSISDFSVDGEEDEELMEDPVSRGYLLRLEDLTANEWKRIFGGMFRFLWPMAKNGEENAESSVDEVQVDGILVANMCRITKNFVSFPAVHRLICDENEDDEKEWLLSRLAVHAYNPDIAALLHGLIHLSIRRGFEYFPIIRCLVQRIVEQVPTRLARSLSSVSSTSTVSSTSSTSPRSSLSGSPALSPSSFFSSKTTPLSPSLFTSNTTSTVHGRISGCAEILTKILKDEFPNTFRYFIQTKIQLASFESLKCAVLAALTENTTILARLAELEWLSFELLDVVILMSNDRVDSRLTRLDLATSLMDIFEKFPKASILHCRLVKLYLNLLNRPSTNGRVNNPLLRSVFRSPDSILEFILNKLDSNSSTHIYDAHLAIIGLIRQFCNNVKGWNDFAASLVATHYQKMDALDDSLLGLQVVTGGTRNGTPRKRNTSEDDADTSFVLARPSSQPVNIYHEN